MLLSHPGQSQTFLGRINICANMRWSISGWEGEQGGGCSLRRGGSRERVRGPARSDQPPIPTGNMCLLSTLLIQASDSQACLDSLSTKHTVASPNPTTEQMKKLRCLSEPPSRTQATVILSSQTCSSPAESEAHLVSALGPGRDKTAGSFQGVSQLQEAAGAGGPSWGPAFLRPDVQT